MSELHQRSAAVQVTVPSLVALNQQASAIRLSGGRIQARQGGDYQSPFKGRGMEFDESRLYQPGDDIRNIDWRVTARTGKPHTKMFREERERPVFVWVDLRAPMFFATRGSYKAVQAARLASLIAWSAVQHGDRVGAVLFSEKINHELKPQRGKLGALRLINQLVAYPTWGQDGIPPPDEGACSRALVRLRRVVRPGSLVFLLSDFRHLDEAAETQLLRLCRHNDVVMIYIHDVLEQRLPPAGRYRVSNDREEVLLDTFDKGRVQDYVRRHLRHREHLARIARRGNIRLLTCTTQDDPLTVLQTGLGAPRKQ
jgi:uncharacterized protein (DUF58 family)